MRCAVPKPKTSTGDGVRVNRSAAIREMLAANPKAQSRDVVAQLAKRGVKVRPTLVYYIKGRLKHQARRQRRQDAAEASRRTGAVDPVLLVVRTRELARDAGGIHNLKILVDALAE